MNRDTKLKKARLADREDLAELRVRAMEPSLRAVGRFDPARAKARFLDTFDPDQTIIVFVKKRMAGFYMITESQDLKMNHLYIDPEFQNMGLGKLLIHRVKETATQKRKNIVLEALKQSPANDFYISQGFKKIGELESDNVYRWTPSISVF